MNVMFVFTGRNETSKCENFNKKFTSKLYILARLWRRRGSIKIAVCHVRINYLLPLNTSRRQSSYDVWKTNLYVLISETISIVLLHGFSKPTWTFPQSSSSIVSFVVFYYQLYFSLISYPIFWFRIISGLQHRGRMNYFISKKRWSIDRVLERRAPFRTSSAKILDSPLSVRELFRCLQTLNFVTFSKFQIVKVGRM